MRVWISLFSSMAVLGCVDESGADTDGGSSSSGSSTTAATATPTTATTAADTTSTSGSSGAADESSTGTTAGGSSTGGTGDTGGTGSTGSTGSTGGSSSGGSSTGGAGSQIGQPCVNPDDCDDPLACTEVAKGFSICTEECTPFDAMEDCPGDNHCAIAVAEPETGYCFPATGEGSAILDSCDVEFAMCAEDTGCFDIGGGTLLCLGLCRTAMGNDDCAEPTPTCLDQGNGIGVCT